MIPLDVPVASCVSSQIYTQMSLLMITRCFMAEMSRFGDAI